MPNDLPAAAPAPSPTRVGWRWDVFCRVIDNHGDLGVCWRLSAELAARGHRVRLWVDEPAALSWMAPEGAPRVTVMPWREPTGDEQPGGVVVEAFGCDPPPGFLARMASATRPPVWINLEYLSAEPYVARSHGLKSPQFNGPAAGLDKWFFYPGFTPATGGLLREPGLPAPTPRRSAGDTLVATLFCYAPAALPSLLQALSSLPTGAGNGLPRRALLRVTPGWATGEVTRLLGLDPSPILGATHTIGTLTLQFLPPVSQPAFDALLHGSDLNFVRGEDSLVRAIWAGRPFLWQLYPQDDGAHATKLEAFLATCVSFTRDPRAEDRTAVEPTGAATDSVLWRAWNGLAPPPTPRDWHAALAQLDQGWSAQAMRLESALRTHPDLVSQLVEFVDERRNGALGPANG